MENTSTQSSIDYMERKQKQDARMATIIAVVVLTLLTGFMAYIFLGH